jgi:bifunctional DNA-binding transcriptional regulator/antitoxin component of YhaV-PrlF toxin-antitoxin module
MSQATLCTKNQIAIAREARCALSLKPGDKLLVTVLADRVMIIQKPKSLAKALYGIARGLCPEDYFRKEPAPCFLEAQIELL